MESLTSGTLAGTGSFRCEVCGHVVEMTTADVLPACPGCDGRELHARLAVRRHRPLQARRARRARPPATPTRSTPPATRSTSPGRYLDLPRRRRACARSRCPASRCGSAAACRPTCASRTRPSRAATRCSSPSPTASACSTTAASTACSSTASASCRSVLADGDEIVIGRYRLRFADRSALRRRQPPAPPLRRPSSIRRPWAPRSQSSRRRAAPARRPRCAR